MPEASSTLGFPANREAVYHIDSHHYNMCKFKDTNQESYKLLERVLLELTERVLFENQAYISQETSRQLEFSRFSDKLSPYCTPFAYWSALLELEEV